MSNPSAAMMYKTLAQMRKLSASYAQGNRDAVIQYWRGFESGFLLGASYDVKIGMADDRIYQHVIMEHGWKMAVNDLFQQMAEKELPEQAIVEEIIDIYMEVLRRRYKLTEDDMA